MCLYICQYNAFMDSHWCLVKAKVQICSTRRITQFDSLLCRDDNEHALSIQIIALPLHQSRPLYFGLGTRNIIISFDAESNLPILIELQRQLLVSWCKVVVVDCCWLQV